MFERKPRNPNVVLNGEVPSRRGLAQMARALADPAILTEKGGFLFRAAVLDEVLHVGMVPSFQDGQRNYHYDIPLPETRLSLTGFVNPDGSLTVLFVVPGRLPDELTDADRRYARGLYARLAGFLLEAGVPSGTPVEETTRAVIEEAALSAREPMNLTELAEGFESGSCCRSPCEDG